MKSKSNNKKKPFYKKWWFIGLIVVVILGSIGSNSDKKKTNETQLDTTIANKEKQNDANEIANTNKEDNESEIRREDMTLDQYLEYTVKKILGDKTNTDKPIFISVNDGDEGIKDITLNANNNLTNNMIINGIEMNSSKYLREISQDKEVMKLKAISLIFQMTLIDSYGNESDNPVLIITISTEALKKINWDNFLSKNLKTISDTYFIHSALQK